MVLRLRKKMTPLSPYAVYQCGSVLIVKERGKKPIVVQRGKKKKGRKVKRS